MMYRNSKTGAVIDVESEVSGGDWEKVPAAVTEPANDKAPEQETVKKRSIKKAAKDE